MLLNELLIKIGVEADEQTLHAFGQALETLGQNSAEFAEQFGQLITEMEALEQSAGDMSDVALFDAWQEKAQAFNALMQDYAGVFENVELAIDEATQSTQAFGQAIEQGAEDTRQAAQSMGNAIADSANEVKKVEHASEKAAKALEQQTKETQENTDANHANQQSLNGMTESLGGFILAALGLDKATGKFEALGGSINSLPKVLGVLSGVLSGAVAGLTAFVDKTLDSLDGIYQLSNVTGEATEYIYHLGKVAETSGSSIEAAEASIMGLSRVIGEAASGAGRGAKAFELYGLKAKNAKGEIKQTSEVLEEIRQKMVGMSQQEQIAMLAKLGIDGSMIQVLMKDAEEFRAEMAAAKAMTLGVGTQEDAKTAAEFKDALADFFKMLKAISEVVALRLAPALTNLLGKFKEWFIVNNQLIRNGLALFAGILAGIIDGITGFMTAVDNVITHTVGWENAFYLIGAAIMWLVRGPLFKLTMALLTNPFTWIIAGIVGLLLVIEDLVVFLNGGESLFAEYWGPMVKWVKMAYSKVLEFYQFMKSHLPEAFLSLGLTVALFGRQLVKIGSLARTIFSGLMRFSGIGKIFSLLTGGVGKVIAVFGWLIGKAKALGLAIRAAFMANPVGLIITAVTALIYLIYWLVENWDEVKKAVGEFVDDAEKWLKELTDKISKWFDEKCQAIGEGFIELGKIIKKPFDEAFAWVKAKYDEYIKPIIDAIANLSFDGIAEAANNALDSAGNALKSGWESMKSGVSEFFGGSPETLQAVGNSSNFAKSAVVNRTEHHQQSDNRKFNYHVTQNIQGVSDPKRVADLSARAIQNTAGTTVQ